MSSWKVRTVFQIRRTARASTWIDCVNFNIATVVFICQNSELPKKKFRNKGIH